MSRVDELRSLREACGLSQNALARRYGLNPTTVRNWSAGNPEPPPWIVQALEDLRRLQQRGQDR